MAGLEVVVWAVLSGRRRAVVAFLALGAVAAVVSGAAMRFAPDAAAMNRLSIWWAGLKLSAMNPFGVGLGNSGLLVSSFMLDGIECRTLVNSHLTLFSEMGWVAGCAWMMFVVSGIVGEVGKLRTWCAFVGLSFSAFSSSVFDWHILFGVKDGFSGLNLWLSLILLVFYVGSGFCLILRSLTLRRLPYAIFPVASIILLLPLMPKTDVPAVQNGFVVKKGESMPFVFRDGTWSLRSVLPYLNDGYRIKITPGCSDAPANAESVMLFGTAAESAFRFPNAEIMLVAPPEFCVFPPNVKLMR